MTENCGQPCALNSYSESVDKLRWYCKDCSLRRSIRINSFFFRSHLSLRDCLSLLYMWSYKYTHSVIVHELNLSKQTVTDWQNFIRDLTTNWCENLAPQLGGIHPYDLTGLVVEIDESVFGKRKYHVGRPIRLRWVFGGTERGSRKFTSELH
jgi:hypothetical protein